MNDHDVQELCFWTKLPKGTGDGECGCDDVCPGCGRRGHEDKPKCYLC